MGHTIRYTGEESEKVSAALQDVKSYLGDKKFALILDEVKKLPCSKDLIRTLRVQFSLLVGIEGFPVTAILASAWAKTTKEIIDMEVL